MQAIHGVHHRVILGSEQCKPSTRSKGRGHGALTSPCAQHGQALCADKLLTALEDWISVEADLLEPRLLDRRGPHQPPVEADGAVPGGGPFQASPLRSALSERSFDDCMADDGAQS